MKRLSIGVSLLLLLATIGLVIFQRDIRDYLALRGYDPPAEVVSLADETTMLDDSRRLFYVTHPKLTDPNEFNQHCRENEHTIVLGCYVPKDTAIYLLDVEDERLSGVKQVTAAHEFLHIAYERLSGREKSRINKLLEKAYEDLDNTRVIETIELYRKQDASVVLNEMHSILGTEVRKLPTDLELYYGQYFGDRTKIVAFSERYEQAFTERRNAVRDYDTKLQSLKTKINSLSVQLENTDKQLKSTRDHMNNLKAQGKTSEYNAAVPEYNKKVVAYNADIDRLQDMVKEYNAIVQARNAVAAEEAELVDAIDSRDVVPDSH